MCFDDTGNFFWQRVRGRYTQQQLDDAITTAAREFGYEAEVSTEDSEKCLSLRLPEKDWLHKKRMRITYDTMDPKPEEFEVSFDGLGMHLGNGADGKPGEVERFIERVYELLRGPKPAATRL